MTEELKQAAQQALEALGYGVAWKEGGHQKARAAIDALGAALTTSQPAQAGCNHVLYETADADRPKEICDQNGEVVLAMCKLCRKAESELEATQPAAQATPETLTLGPLAKRNIYDAIRGAYDLGYNDARNARTVPGDSAPGYDGRSVEEDHGGALFNLLSRRLKTATFTHPAPGVPDVEDLRDRLVAISAAVADSDDRAAQAMLGEILRALAAAQAKGGGNG